MSSPPVLLPSGNLDTSFGGDGLTSTPVGAGTDQARSIAIQADGKYVVAGWTDVGGGNDDFAVMRFNANGSLDATFSGDGFQTTPFAGNDQAYGVGIQSTGKIVVAGTTTDGTGDANVALARYNTDGSLDTSFDTDGQLTFSSFTGTTSFEKADEANAIAIQSDDKILVAGNSYFHYLLLRYNADGTVDNTFSGDGRVVEEFGNQTSSFNSLAVQADGRIIAAGYRFTSSTYDLGVARFEANGALDTSFNPGVGSGSVAGDALINLGAYEQVKAVALQADGKILLAGYTGTDFFNTDAFVIRLDANGNLDASFGGGDGIVMLDVSAQDAFNSIVVQTDGKIIAAGADDLGNGETLIARFDSSGTLDTTFAAGGVLSEPFVSGTSAIHGLATMANGQVVAAGDSFNGGTYNIGMLRLAAGVTDQAATAGQAFTYAVPAGTFYDPDTPSLNFSAALAGGGALPAWLAFNPMTRTFSGTPGDGQFGTQQIEVTASDGTASVEANFQLEVTTPFIEALRYTSHARWNDASANGTPGTALTFSFMTAAPSYAVSLESSTFQPVSVEQQDAVRAVLALYQEIAGISFTEVADTGAAGGGQLRFGTYFSNALTESAYAYGPSSTGQGGDVWVNRYYTGWDTPAAGDSDFETLLHEIGHALGMKHPGPYGGGVAPYLADGAVDSNQYTVMSYNNRDGDFFLDVTPTLLPPPDDYDFNYFTVSARTPMLYDVATLQFLYGANAATHAGNDIYTFDPAAPFFKTIWDGGGNDTISAANFLIATRIDLRDGHFSSLHILSEPLPPGYFGTLGDYDGTDNLAIAFGAVIENAIGGSGNDTLTGNFSDNLLSGGAGNDWVEGGLGNDFLRGNQGADTLLGEDGNDQLFGDNGNDTIAGGLGADNINGNNGLDTVDGGAGNDTIHGGTEGDVLSGGDGNDLVFGDKANDTLDGGAGNDSLLGGLGNDVLRGNQGADTLVGDEGNDQLLGDNGNDTIAGGLGDDNINGNNGFDTVDGGAGNDTIHGGTEADVLSGGDDDDLVFGDKGNDTVVGGAGDDTLVGGIGIDFFRYDAANLGTGDVTANGHDVISDGIGELISLLGLNDDLAIGGTALDSLSSDAIVGGALAVGTSVAFVGDVLQIDLNLDGAFNAADDFQITLTGVTTVSYNATDDLFHLA